MGEQNGDVDKEYWGNRLEVNADLVIERHADRRYLDTWVRKLSRIARQLLVHHLGMDTQAAAGQQRLQLLAIPGQLLPVLLVAAATSGKRSTAIVEVARQRLEPDAVNACRGKAGRHDRLALMWQLYCADRRNLELVFHLDRVQSRGVARMVLTSRPRGMVSTTAAFFTKPNIQGLLDDYERATRSRRTSLCSEILRTRHEHFQVFIKRDYKPAFVSKGAQNTFGFAPEWMVLEFEPDLHRVRVSSQSTDVPATLANQIATAFFGVPSEYENESIYTHADKLKGFLSTLIRDPDTLPLVELVSVSTRLLQAPVLRLSDRLNRSLAPTVRHFASAFGNPLDDVEGIRYLKVLWLQHRVKLVFEEGRTHNTFVVRYLDQPLGGDERREFERMMRDRYAITVLSTEKRHAA